jgi:PKD repeat protein
MKKLFIIIGIFVILVCVCLNGCTKTINLSPIATIYADKTSGDIYPLANLTLTVHFEGLGVDPDGRIVSYEWDFSDGDTSNKQNLTHTFTKVGTYNVTLTVTDNNGGTGITSITITAFEHTSTWHFVESFSGTGLSGGKNITDSFLINAYSSSWKLEWRIYPWTYLKPDYFNLRIVRSVNNYTYTTSRLTDEGAVSNEDIGTRFRVATVIVWSV